LVKREFKLSLLNFVQTPVSNLKGFEFGLKRDLKRSLKLIQSNLKPLEFQISAPLLQISLKPPKTLRDHPPVRQETLSTLILEVRRDCEEKSPQIGGKGFALPSVPRPLAGPPSAPFGRPLVRPPAGMFGF